MQSYDYEGQSEVEVQSEVEGQTEVEVQSEVEGQSEVEVQSEDELDRQTVFVSYPGNR